MAIQGNGIRLYHLQPLARDQDEQDAQSGVNEESNGKNHEGSFGEKLTDVRLSNLGVIKGCVFAETNKSHDRV